jgi:hypothetical protein
LSEPPTHSASVFYSFSATIWSTREIGRQQFCHTAKKNGPDQRGHPSCRVSQITRGDGDDDDGDDGGDGGDRAPVRLESRKPRTQLRRWRPKRKQIFSLKLLLGWFPWCRKDGESIGARQTHIYEWPFRIAMIRSSVLMRAKNDVVALRVTTMGNRGSKNQLPGAGRRITKTAGARFSTEVARSERFELPTLGFEVRCSIQLSYERSFERLGYQTCSGSSTAVQTGTFKEQFPRAVSCCWSWAPDPGFFMLIGMLNGLPTH